MCVVFVFCKFGIYRSCQSKEDFNEPMAFYQTATYFISEYWPVMGNVQAGTTYCTAISSHPVIGVCGSVNTYCEDAGSDTYKVDKLQAFYFSPSHKP